VILTFLLLLITQSLSAQIHIDDIDELIACLEQRESADIEANFYSSDKILNWGAYPTCEARVQCNSFHNMVLNHCYALNIYEWTGRRFYSPNAAFIHDQIVLQNQYTVVSSIHNLQVGDTIAIKYPAGWSTSGHIMFVHDVPELRTATAPLIPDTDQYGVMVVDSSSGYHGTWDTRKGNEFEEGVGLGEFRLYVDTTTEQIIGYTWSTYASSEYRALVGDLVLVLGRFHYP